MVSEVIYSLVRLQVRVDQYCIDMALIHPNDIPGVILGLFVPFRFQGIKYAVSEGSFEFYL